MPACSCNQQGTFRLLLSDDIAHVRQGILCCSRGGLRMPGKRWPRSVEVLAELQQAGEGQNPQVLHTCRFTGIGGWQGEAVSGSRCGQGCRQDTLDRAKFAGKRQFANEFVLLQFLPVNLAACGEDADGNRQVEAAALFRQVGRSQVDGDPSRRKLEIGVGNGGPDPFTTLLYGLFGEPDDRE